MLPLLEELWSHEVSVRFPGPPTNLDLDSNSGGSGAPLPTSRRLSQRCGHGNSVPPCDTHGVESLHWIIFTWHTTQGVSRCTP